MWTSIELASSADYDERRRLIRRLVPLHRIAAPPAAAEGLSLSSFGRWFNRGVRSCWRVAGRHRPPMDAQRTAPYVR